MGIPTSLVTSGLILRSTHTFAEHLRRVHIPHTHSHARRDKKSQKKTPHQHRVLKVINILLSLDTSGWVLLPSGFYFRVGSTSEWVLLPGGFYFRVGSTSEWVLLLSRFLIPGKFYFRVVGPGNNNDFWRNNNTNMKTCAQFFL